MSERDRTSKTDGRHLVVRNQREAIDAAQQQIMDDIKQSGLPESSCFAIRLALEECLTNAWQHGNERDPKRSITIDWDVAPEAVRVTVKDEGAGFDPDSVPDPTADENLEIPCGRGLMLMRAYMSEVEVHPPGNRVTMIYSRED